jgi:hypothetical protein
LEQFKDELDVEYSTTTKYRKGSATMDYAYNYDMLCDAERTLSFDYIRHSRKDRLTYVASPFYLMEKSAKVGA